MSDLLCHLCGEGLLEPIGRTSWAQCSECKRAVDLEKIEEQRRREEERARTREIEECFREDQHRDIPRRNSGKSGKSRKEQKCGIAYVPTSGDTAPPPWVLDDSVVRTKRPLKKIPVSCRFSPALLDLFQRLGLTREQRVNAIRVAISEILFHRHTRKEGER